MTVEVYIDSNQAWNVVRTYGSVTQTSKSANNAVTFGVTYHVAVAFPNGSDHLLYVNGEPVTLTHTGTALSGPLTIGTNDEIALGAATIGGRVGFAGDMGRFTLWPFVMSASRVKASYRQQNDFAQWVGISGENASSDANRAPTAVPVQEALTSGVAKTIPVISRAYDPDGDALSIQAGSLSPSTGTASIVSDQVVWTPAPSYEGDATCGFILQDGGTKSSVSKVYATVKKEVTPPNKWWLISTLERDGRHWAGGPGYYQASRNTWVTKCGKWTAVTESIKRRNSTGDQDWDGITGGPATDSLTNPSIKNGSQVDFSDDLDSAFRQASPDSAFMCAVMAAWPRTLSTSGNKNERRVYTEILGGTRDREYALLGARLKKKFQSYGWSNLDLLVLRINHECNGSNIYQVFPETTDLYRRAMERAYEKMRDGAGHRLRIIQSVERSKDIGRLQDWMPQSAAGGIDSVNVSWHPGPQITIRDFYDNYDKFLAKWNNSSYGVLEGQAANVALGLPDVAPEYAPKYDLDNGSPPCEASAMANRQFAKYLRQLARDRRLIFETIYNQTSLRPDAYLGSDAPGKAEWAKMVAEIPDLWRGASKGTVPKLDTNPDAVTMSGTGLTYNPFPRCTANGAVEISRIVSVSGGISARVTGTGPNGRVEIDKNGAAPGRKKLFVEMCLTNMKHYLTDVEVEVTVT